MLVGTNGVVVDELARVLLIRRNDTRTMAPPGGSLDSGELPPEGLAREIREETGLIVMPVRLVGLYYVPLRPNGNLAFVFRCIQRGGQLGPTQEAPIVAFYPAHKLPGPMIDFHRTRLEDALAHRGGPAMLVSQPFPWRLRLAKFLLDNLVYRFFDLRRSWRRQPPLQPPTLWCCSAHLVLTGQASQVLWRPQANGQWALPGGRCRHLEPPWQTAARLAHELGLQVDSTYLSGVYLQNGENHLHFVFAAQVASGQPSVNRGTYFDYEQEPTDGDSWHRTWVADACRDDEGTVFRRQEDPGP